MLARIPRGIEVSGKSPGRLTIECDEMWSFVDSKKNSVYILLAVARNNREIVGCFIGDKNRKSARKLWASLPAVNQQCTVAYTDFWQAYKTVIPPKRPRSVGRQTGQTNHVEQLNNTNRAAGFSTGSRKLIIFQKAQQSHWSDLVLRSWLQCGTGKDLSFTTTSISLPSF